MKFHASRRYSRYWINRGGTHKFWPPFKRWGEAYKWREGKSVVEITKRWER